MSRKIKNMSVTRKQIMAMVTLVLIVLILVMTVVGVQMAILFDRQDKTYDNIFESAKEVDTDALLSQAEKSLKAIVVVQTEATDLRLAGIRKTIELIADEAEKIYAAPEKYVDEKRKIQSLAEGVSGEYMNGYLIDGGGELTDELQEELSYVSALGEIFITSAAYNEEFSQIYFGSESGLYYKYTDRGTYDAAFDARQRPWYQKAMEHPDEVAWQETYVDYSGRLCITVAKTVRDADGDIVGVVGADVNFESMANQILADGLGESGTSMLLGEDYDLIAYRGMEEEGFDKTLAAHFEDPEAFIANVTDADTSAFFAVMDGKRYYMTSQVLPENGWIFCTAVDEAEVLASIEALEGVTSEIVEEESRELSALSKRFMNWDIILLLLLTALAIFSAVKVAQSITRPLKKLTAGVSRIGAGEFDKKLPVESRDEVGTLAAAFNRMQDNLKAFLECFRNVIADNERIGSELNVATQIQADMLPRIFPPFPDKREVDIYATMKPAKEVGGDFYDFFLVDDDHLAFVIADVSGKGVPAALFMVISKTLIKNRAQAGGTPAEILADTNNQLCEGNEAELFVTVWLGILELSTGKITAANAGHEFPAIRDAQGNFTLLRDRHGFVLAGMENMRYKNYEVQLEPGGGFFVYTDGVPEATNAQNELYGTDRMIEALNRHKGAAPIEFLKDVRESCEAFVDTAPQFDDMTMVGVVWKGGGDMPSASEKLLLEADTDELSKLQVFLEEKLEEHSCPMSVQTQVQVAAEEIFVNIAHYAYPEGGGKAHIWLDFEKDPEGGPETMILRFLDSGVPFDPLAKADPDVTATAEERRIGGLGIYMVKKSMDDVTYMYEDGKNILTLRKKMVAPPRRRRKSAEAAAAEGAAGEAQA